MEADLLLVDRRPVSSVAKLRPRTGDQVAPSKHGEHRAASTVALDRARDGVEERGAVCEATEDGVERR